MAFDSLSDKLQNIFKNLEVKAAFLKLMSRQHSRKSRWHYLKLMLTLKSLRTLSSQ